MCLRDRQPLRIGATADDCCDAAWQVCLQQGLQVATATGDEDYDALHSSADLGLVLVAFACADDADARYRFPCGLQVLDRRICIGCCDYHHHADAAVEGAEHLLRLD